jgi:glutamate synthase (NADPH/NADH) large chain/glutamate synthase (ferredoxin)
MLFSALPDRQGLYDPENESDSCGVAMVTDIQGRRSHSIVADGLIALEHLEHRGAAGAEPNSGDGAGILIQLPVELLREVVDFELPAATEDGCNTFAAGICFMPQDAEARAVARAQDEAIADEERLQVLGWREVPVDPGGAEVGVTALGCMPYMAQLFVSAPENNIGGIDLDRRAYAVRKRAERNGVYFPSLSGRTMVYKGMLTTMQLPQYSSGPARRTMHECDRDRALCRFSTNTFVLAACAPPGSSPQR